MDSEEEAIYWRAVLEINKDSFLVNGSSVGKNFSVVSSEDGMNSLHKHEVIAELKDQYMAQQSLYTLKIFDLSRKSF